MTCFLMRVPEVNSSKNTILAVPPDPINPFLAKISVWRSVCCP
jgi:hypothetical protein